VLLVETSFTAHKGIQSKIEELTRRDLENIDAADELKELFPGWYASNLWNGKTVARNHQWHRWLRDQLQTYRYCTGTNK
jgi:hypothetical protein